MQKNIDNRLDINKVIKFLTKIIGKELDENSIYNLDNNIKIPKKLGRYEVILSNEKKLEAINSK